MFKEKKHIGISLFPYQPAYRFFVFYWSVKYIMFSNTLGAIITDKLKREKDLSQVR